MFLDESIVTVAVLKDAASFGSRETGGTSKGRALLRAAMALHEFNWSPGMHYFYNISCDDEGIAYITINRTNLDKGKNIGTVAKSGESLVFEMQGWHLKPIRQTYDIFVLSNGSFRFPVPVGLETIQGTAVPTNVYRPRA